ncbi:salicylate esterase [Paenibacillus baekrokdamisoli]|uniref:Salicylate esterase n=1 Tax=Paenibacillus baekrokdamisoli TaxID=1712516 RepID=A0A3G9J9C4_9BACL|nr:alpha/beta fold hydrolase [Paenibacillus baekrokdamisoli]BBH20468.1 salicylate esterase [Paenibacillus baekrokdamisoli]
MYRNEPYGSNAYYYAAPVRQSYPISVSPYAYTPAISSDMRFEHFYPPYAQPAWSHHANAPWVHGNLEDTREKQQPLTFVLIHGAWADASFWNGTAAELRRKGHTVYAPEYPGHGSDPNKNVTHAMLTKSIADFIVTNHLKNVVLVGHSFGGSLVQTVAQQIPDRIKRMVFFDAFVLKDGQSVADELPPSTLEAFNQLRKSSKDDTIMLPFPLFRETFVNLASLELAQQIHNAISPEPAGPLYEKLDLKKFYSLSTPRSYLFLTEDNALPQGSDLYGWFPHMANRLGLFRLIKGQGDHMTTAKTEPRMLAQKIYEAGRD